MESQPHLEPIEGAGPLWTGLLAGPIAALTQLLALYVLTQSACSHHARAALHVVAAVCLLAALIGWHASWNGWKREGSHWPDPGDSGPSAARRFLASLGLLSGGLFVLLIVAEWTAAVALDACPP